MTKNMGWLDRGIRTLIAVAIVLLYFTGQISGIAALVLGVVAVAFLATSLMGSCPAYRPFKFSTRRRGGAAGS